MIVKNLKVPTGNICISEGKDGAVEFISVGDYGKEHNIKASFLGLEKNIEGVPNMETMSLAEKWVITISTQYGCSMNCIFCDVPKVGMGVNCSYDDLVMQIQEALSLHPEISCTKRLNVHYARMGEPTFNDQVLYHATMLHKIIKPYIGNSLIHPVISTMLPNGNKRLYQFLNTWCTDIKNDLYRGDAGLQFSINSTSDEQREKMFSGNSLSLKEISKIGEFLPFPIGRKYALNFAIADDSTIDAIYLNKLFDPDKFMAKITPLHNTISCKENHIQTTNGYNSFVPYSNIENELKEQGFDVIVFIPSQDEEDGLITCGNAVLSGRTPIIKHGEDV